MYTWTNGTELYHFGIKGQKWGVRRYQNEDGTLTAAGKARYMNSDGSYNKRGQKRMDKFEKYRKRTSNKLSNRIDADKRDAEMMRMHADNLKRFGEYSDEYQKYASETYGAVDDESSYAYSILGTIGNQFLRSSQKDQDIASLIAEYEKSADKYDRAIEQLTGANSRIMSMPLSVVTGARDVRKEIRKEGFINDWDSSDDVYRRARERSASFKARRSNDNDIGGMISNRRVYK